MDKFRVKDQLGAPLVTGYGGYLTLDGLLAALLFDELQDVEAAHEAVPIRRTDGLFHASAAVMEPYHRRFTMLVAGLHAKHSMDPDLLLKNRHGRVHRKFDSSLANVTNPAIFLEVPEITWYAEGDARQA